MNIKMIFWPLSVAVELQWTSPASPSLSFSDESLGGAEPLAMPYCSSWQKDCESADGLIVPVKPQQMQIWPNSRSIYSNGLSAEYCFLC